jgi:predicted Zn-dependent protease
MGEEPARLERVLRPWPQHFTPLGEAEPGSWLFTSEETEQTFDQYVKQRPNRPAKKKKTIYLLPFEESGPAGKVGCYPDLELLRSMVEAWFLLPCKLLPAKNVMNKKGITKRRCIRPDEQQYDAGGVLKELESLLPRDGYCLLGVTMQDIYSGKLAFVYGLASFRSRCGVFSFARHDPCWFRCKQIPSVDIGTPPQTIYATERTAEDEANLLKGALFTMVHEIGHQFAIRHCRFFQCKMQGSNGPHDKSWHELCPVCLRKLAWNIGGSDAVPRDVNTPSLWCLERYRRLAEFYGAINAECKHDALAEAQRYVEERLAYLESEASEPPEWLPFPPDWLPFLRQKTLAPEAPEATQVPSGTPPPVSETLESPSAEVQNKSDELRKQASSPVEEKAPKTQWLCRQCSFRDEGARDAYHLLRCLPQAVQDHLNSESFEEHARGIFLAAAGQEAEAEAEAPLLLPPEAVEPLVAELVPESYRSALNCSTADLVLSFDRNEDGRISFEEFDDLLRWHFVMTMKQYFNRSAIDGSPIEEVKGTARSELSSVPSARAQPNEPSFQQMLSDLEERPDLPPAFEPLIRQRWAERFA